MQLSVIAAVADNGVIGRDGRLPWHLPDEMRHFRRVTLGKAVVMGRLTWESLRRPLRDRLNLVVTSRDGWTAEGAERAGSLDDALAQARAAGHEEAVVIGGARLYAEAVPRADRLYLTHVEAEVEGDVRFPPIDLTAWTPTHEERHARDERHAFAFRMTTYDRR